MSRQSPVMWLSSIDGLLERSLTVDLSDDTGGSKTLESEAEARGHLSVLRGGQ